MLDELCFLSGLQEGSIILNPHAKSGIRICSGILSSKGTPAGRRQYKQLQSCKDCSKKNDPAESEPG